MKALIQALSRVSTNGFIEGQARPLQRLKPSPDGIGTYLSGKRTPEYNVHNYLFPKNDLNHYLGSIVLVDEKFRSENPTKVIIKESERKPLRITCSLGTSSAISSDVIVPSEANVNNFRHNFINRYISNLNSRSFLARQLEINSYEFDSQSGVSISGNISGVDFGFDSGGINKKVKVFELKQILYTMSIDDQYRELDDFITDKLSESALLGQLKGDRGTLCHPAYIETIRYGRVAYLAVSSTDSKALSINIGKTSFGSLTSNIGKSHSKCEFSLIVRGGALDGSSITSGGLNYSEASEIIKTISREMTAKEAQAAVPIEFEANYLVDPQKKVETQILPYFQTYVDSIRFRITDDNTGTSYRCTTSYIEPTARGRYRYHRVGKKAGYDRTMSPLSLAIEIKVDKLGVAGGRDYNLFLPFIPVELLRPDNDGVWTMRVYLQGKTLFSNAVGLNPTFLGCYRSDNNNIYITNRKNSRKCLAHTESFYQGKSEDAIIKEFLAWCEYYVALTPRISKSDDRFVRLTPKKANLNGR